MGSWGTDINENDIYMDVEAEFLELLAEEKTSKEIYAHFDIATELEDEISEETHDWWFAIADLFWKIGYLEDKVLKVVKTIIETKADLAYWKECDADPDFIKLRAKYFNTSAASFRSLIKTSLETSHLGKTELISLYTKHLKQFPNLVKEGHNQAIFKIKFFENGKLFDEVEEFSLSGDLDKMIKSFGNPPKFPPNTVNVLDDFEEFETFVTGAYDLSGTSRKFDSEIKFIYNFLKNHAHKADEFIIETSNIFKTCGSCSREFVLLKQLLEQQGKKLRIIVKADESIKGTSNLMKKYPELKKLKKQK